MDIQQLQHVAKNDAVYAFVASGGKTETEMKDFILGKDKKKSATSFYDFMRPLKKDGVGLLIMEDDKVVIDSAKARVLVDQLEAFLGFESSESEMSKLSQRLESMTAENQKLTMEIKDLKVKQKKSNSEIRLLKKKAEQGQQYVKDMIVQKTIYRDSVSIGPRTEVMDGLFLDNVDSLVEADNSPVEVSYLEEIIENNQDKPVREHNWENYIFASIRKVVTEKLLRKRVEDLTLAKEIEKQPQEVQDDYLDLIRKNRRWSVQSILDSKNMTNQEKLAMYAFYSDYHHSDMEQLINFAGDEGINADLLIQILEQPGRQCAYENTRDLLRQFKKPTEFAIRQKFAEELIQGKWYIMAQHGEERTKFQLVPVKELNELRAIVGLAPCSIGKADNAKDAIKKTAKIVEKKELKSEVKLNTFNSEEDSLDDIPDIEMKEDVEDGK